MDCHRCANLRYAGCRYGRCSHPGHQDVVLTLKKGERSKYSRKICPDFVMKKLCSNCKYWIRGRYFADGITPATKGRCSLKILRSADECPMWGAGPTSSRKRKVNQDEKASEKRG